MFVVVMGIYFQALVRGCQFLQVKLFSFCKYSAVPPPTLPPTVQIQISYLRGVELTPWEKRKMLLFLAFCYRLQDFFRNMASWDCKDRMLSEVLLGVSVL